MWKVAGSVREREWEEIQRPQIVWLAKFVCVREKSACVCVRSLIGVDFSRKTLL